MVGARAGAGAGAGEGCNPFAPEASWISLARLGTVRSVDSKLKSKFCKLLRQVLHPVWLTRRAVTSGVSSAIYAQPHNSGVSTQYRHSWVFFNACACEEDQDEMVCGCADCPRCTVPTRTNGQGGIRVTHKLLRVGHNVAVCIPLSKRPTIINVERLEASSNHPRRVQRTCHLRPHPEQTRARVSRGEDRAEARSPDAGSAPNTLTSSKVLSLKLHFSLFHVDHPIGGVLAAPLSNAYTAAFASSRTITSGDRCTILVELKSCKTKRTLFVTGGGGGCPTFYQHLFSSSVVRGGM